jgi:hypothetical protein
MYSEMFPYLVTGAIAITLGDFVVWLLVWRVGAAQRR